MAVDPLAGKESAEHEFWRRGVNRDDQAGLSLSGQLARAAGRVYLRTVLATDSLLTRRRPRELRSGSADPIHVLAVGPFYSMNWVAAHLRPLASARRVARVSVIVPEPYDPIEGVEYLSFDQKLARRIGTGAARVRKAWQFCRRERPQLVIGYHLPWNGCAALLMARATGARAAYFSVGGPPEFLGGGRFSEHALFSRIPDEDARLEMLFKRVIGRFDAAFTMGGRSADVLGRFENPPPVYPVSVGVDDHRFPDGTGHAKDIDVITVGRLAHIKRQDILLDAIAMLKQRGQALTCMLVGEGPERAALEARATELDIAELVTFAGFRTDVTSLLHRARLFVMTSASEGLPLSLIEAMLTGLPAVVPHVGDIADLVTPGESGMLVRPGQTDQFAESIGRLMSSPEDYSRMSELARERAMSYSAARRASDWDSVLDDFLPVG